MNDTFDVESSGQACLDQMAQAGRALAPALVKEAISTGANFLLIAKLENAEDSPVVAQVRSRLRSLRYAAA